MKILFLDESGDHNLIVSDPNHPIFVLGGVIIEATYVENQLPKLLNAFKANLFGRTDIHLHTADFTRQRNGFERMTEREFCERFYREFNTLLAAVPMSVVACAIHKQSHMEKYGLAAIDPYHLSLNLLVERFCFDLDNHSGSGLIVAEKRDPTLDRQLELAWLNLKVSGTQYVQASDIERKIQSLNLRSKLDNLAGLEIADALVTPIARMVLGRPSRIDTSIIKQKMRKSRFGDIAGYGLLTLPKK